VAIVGSYQEFEAIPHVLLDWLSHHIFADSRVLDFNRCTVVALNQVMFVCVDVCGSKVVCLCILNKLFRIIFHNRSFMVF